MWAQQSDMISRTSNAVVSTKADVRNVQGAYTAAPGTNVIYNVASRPQLLHHRFAYTADNTTVKATKARVTGGTDKISASGDDNTSIFSRSMIFLQAAKCVNLFGVRLFVNSVHGESVLKNSHGYSQFGTLFASVFLQPVLLIPFFHVRLWLSPRWLPQAQRRGRWGRHCQKVSVSLQCSWQYWRIVRKKKKSKVKSELSSKEQDLNGLEGLVTKSDDKDKSTTGSGRNSPASATGSGSSHKTEAEKRFEEVQKRRVNLYNLTNCHNRFTTFFCSSHIVWQNLPTRHIRTALTSSMRIWSPWVSTTTFQRY